VFGVVLSRGGGYYVVASSAGLPEMMAMGGSHCGVAEIATEHQLQLASSSCSRSRAT